jgi:hypothetical protein
MNENSNAGMDTPQIYQLRIKGHLDSHWAAWFEGLEVSLDENGETLLTGIVADQAVLHGLLKKIRDLGLTLVSVSPLDPGLSDRSDDHE